MPKVKVKFDDANLRSSLASYAGALKKGLRETLQYASRQIGRTAQKEMVLTIGRGKKGRASTPAQARREQREVFERRIISQRKEAVQTPNGQEFRYTGQRLPRKTLAVSMLRQSFMAEAEAKRYARVARQNQGELASAWNATITANGGKPIAQWIGKHGDKHGSFRMVENGDNLTAKITAQFQGKDNFNGLAKRAINQTAGGMEKSANAVVNREFRNAKKAGRAKRG